MALHTILNAKRQAQSGATSIKAINKLNKHFNNKLRNKGGRRVRTA